MVLATLCGNVSPPGFALKEATLASSVWVLTDEQCRNAQAKITYLGEQTKPVPTLLFGVGRTPSIAAFLKVQRSAAPYDNDTMPYTKTFTVSSEEFRRMLAAVQPIVANIAEQRPDFLSFAVLCAGNNEVVGEEFPISRALGEAFYRALLTAVSPDNEMAKMMLTNQYKNVYPT
jgi:hypothetical protein